MVEPLATPLATPSALHDERLPPNFVTEAPNLAQVAVRLNPAATVKARPTFVGLSSQKAHEDGPFARVAAGFSPTADTVRRVPVPRGSAPSAPTARWLRDEVRREALRTGSRAA